MPARINTHNAIPIATGVLVVAWSLLTVSRAAAAASDSASSDATAGGSIARDEPTSQFTLVVHKNLRSVVEADRRIFNKYDWSSAAVYVRTAASRPFSHVFFVDRAAGAPELPANPVAGGLTLDGLRSAVPAAPGGFRILALRGTREVYDLKDHWQRRVAHISFSVAPVIIVAAQAVMNRVVFSSQSKPRRFSARVRLRLRPSSPLF